ncbi:MAG TPA: thymidine phosphorylase [Candidatus Acidoferrales bacterium]|nr:thymidine phosphorylase [Candidatus Acidoferrales bacterium]
MRRLIAAKRDGAAIGAQEWAELIPAYLAGSVGDVQMAALLMACVLRGLDAGETQALTEAFVRSGEVLEFPADLAPVVDKHSSGGVGDTASLIVVPLVAACGVRVAKLSGRALGHTGGTLDKLEAVSGVRTDLDPQTFARVVREVGCAIAAQSERLVPADKRLYALRDRTGTVPSLGLIAASIVSKKIAGGAGAIVYDVKCGNGAFMRDVVSASQLAHVLVALTQGFGRAATALVTDMNEPLGRSIGTALEIIEAREFLAGTHRDPRLRTVCLALGRALLQGAGWEPRAADEVLDAALTSGAALQRFEAMLAAQGARSGALAQLAPLGEGGSIAASRAGYVTAIETVALGEHARDLVAAAGSRAGIVVRARIGDAVKPGDALATVYAPGCDDGEYDELVRGAFIIGDEPLPARPLVYAEVTSSGTGDARSTVATR